MAFRQPFLNIVRRLYQGNDSTGHTDDSSGYTDDSDNVHSQRVTPLDIPVKRYLYATSAGPLPTRQGVGSPGPRPLHEVRGGRPPCPPHIRLQRPCPACSGRSPPRGSTVKTVADQRRPISGA